MSKQKVIKRCRIGTSPSRPSQRPFCLDVKEIKMAKPIKLAKSTKDPLDAFDKAAKNWGWQEDRGYGETCAKSEADYLEARGALYDLLLQQQQRLKAAQKKLLDYQPPKESK